MPRLQYYDFDLVIERTATGFRARVIQSPAGQASAEFALPFTPVEIENLILRVGHVRQGLRGRDSPQMAAAKQFGGKLFESVFAGNVRGAFRSSIDSAAREGAGLRLRLRFEDTSELADVPWEYLYDSSLNTFLALSKKSPIVRYMELPVAPRPLKIAPPLRVLVMISSPTDYEKLDVEAEWQKLNSSVSELIASDLIQLERVGTPTLGGLRRKLRQGQYHVLHFIGHGGFDEQTQDGVLILLDEEGRGRRTSGQYLAPVLNDHDTLRLVVLNACEGGRSGLADPFAGVAQSLVQQGIPAVIAMQFEITDDASITFAQEFYAAVADGYPVDAAVADARGAIFAQVNDLEWGTPVLYLRAPDGIIFTPLTEQERAAQEQARAAKENEIKAQQERERQKQIETLILAAQAGLAQKDFDGAEKSIAALVALDPSNPSGIELQRKLQVARIPSVREEPQPALSAAPPPKAQTLPAKPPLVASSTQGNKVKNWWLILGVVGLVAVLLFLGLLALNAFTAGQGNNPAALNAAATATMQANEAATRLALAGAVSTQTAAVTPTFPATPTPLPTATSVPPPATAIPRVALTDSVEVLAILPPPGTILPSNKSFEMTLTLRYRLASADTALLVTYLEQFPEGDQCRTSRHQTIASAPNIPIQRGEREVTVRIPFHPTEGLTGPSGLGDDSYVGPNVSFWAGFDDQSRVILIQEGFWDYREYCYRFTQQ